jgi:aromatic ring hydroxylase
LDLWRARQGRHCASGVSQFRPDARADVRRAARSETASTATDATDTGNGGFTHRYFKIAHTGEELVAGRDAVAEWAKISYGWMGRSPDYKASLTGTLGANAEFYAP